MAARGAGAACRAHAAHRRADGISRERPRRSSSPRSGRDSGNSDGRRATMSGSTFVTAIFSMTCSLFFSLLLAVSMLQIDIASKAAFTAWRASSESPGTDIELKLRRFTALSCMACLLLLRIDVPADRGEAFARDLFERG